jgi:hypothetical protein
MATAKIILLCLFSLTIGNKEFVDNYQGISIIGVAHNAKYGAAVVDADNFVYYIDKMKSWDRATIGRSVRVTGQVKVKKLKKTNVISTTIPLGYIKVIRSPVIELISDR